MGCCHYHFPRDLDETNGRNNIYRKFIYYESLPSSSLLIGSLNELHSPSSNMFFKIARKLYKGEKVNIVCALEYVLLVHRKLLECRDSGHFKIYIWRMLYVNLKKGDGWLSRRGMGG
jgi:hypothetical protein